MKWEENGCMYIFFIKVVLVNYKFKIVKMEFIFCKI